MIIVNLMPLTIITKRSILDVAAVLDPPLNLLANVLEDYLSPQKLVLSLAGYFKEMFFKSLPYIFAPKNGRASASEDYLNGV